MGAPVDNGGSAPKVTGPPVRGPRLVQVVARAAAAAAAEHEVARVIDVLLACTESLGGDSAAFYLLSPDGDALWLARGRNLAPEAERRLRVIPLSSSSIAALAGRERRIQVVEAPEQVPAGLEFSRAVMAEQLSRALFALPLVSGDRLLAVLVTGLPVPHHFGDDELEAIQAIGEAFATSLENARRPEREKSESALLRSVRAAALAIASPHALAEVLRRIVDEARKVADADYAALGVFAAEGGTLRFRVWMVSGSGAPQGELPPPPLALLEAGGAVRASGPAEPRLGQLPEGSPSCAASSASRSSGAGRCSGTSISRTSARRRSSPPRMRWRSNGWPSTRRSRNRARAGSRGARGRGRAARGG